ncbi:MAG: PstS family phosphate ABC transporter substrate-binding protein [Chloroflexi bacterium]|nr:PstS family phosphate ABC transporter substrate-binding protein [Chloroflexota bacterium]
MAVHLRHFALLGAAAILVAACGSGGAASSPDASASHAALSGDIRIDGSSTVYPITEAVAEEFQIDNRGVRVTVAFSGTGGGFKKFCEGKTAANDASRPIKKDEAELCATNGVDPVEIEAAFDGLSVLVNPANDFVTCLTTGELKKIWDQDSTVRTWQDIRAEWPADVIRLFGPGADSGTFDYFTEEINGETDRSRSDYTQSEDDNALVSGIAKDVNGFGYFGFAYYEENADKLKLVEIDGGSGCVAPSRETIADGSYAPLSRPLYIYPSTQSLNRPEVAAFMQFYVDHASALAAEVGYVELPPDRLQKAKDALAEALR